MTKQLVTGFLVACVIGASGILYGQATQYRSCVQVSAATMGTKGGRVCSGNGSPESTLAGWVGDIYLRRDGGAGTTLYIKESGAGTNTGWQVVSGGGGGGSHDLLSSTHSDTTAGSPTHGAMIARDNTGKWAVVSAPSSSNKYLLWNGTGSGFSWETPPAIGGSTTQVQFNSSGAFAGDAGMTYDAATDALTLAGSVSAPYVGLPARTAPSPTSEKLYNVGGTLYWNGTAVGGSGGGGLSSEWVWVQAAQCSNSSTGYMGPHLQADKTIAMPTAFYCQQNYHQFAAASFVDSTEQAMVYVMLLPPDWNSTPDLIIEGAWTSQSYGNVTRTAVWQFATACVADGESDPTFTFNTATVVASDAKANTDRVIRFTTTAVDKTGCAAGELMAIRVSRNPAYADDDLGSTAQFVGFGFKLHRS